MHAEIASRKNEIVEICRSYGVVRLEIFGSAARGTDFDSTKSDADFLVEFEPSREPGTMRELFAFEDALAAAVGREVNLVTELPKNRYLLAAINEFREIVYEA